MNDEFLTGLVTRYLKPGWAKVFEPLKFRSARLEEVITVPPGFEFDWDSVPRIPGIHALLKGRAEKAACLHDWLYYAQPVSRRKADRIFLDAMVAEGVARLHRWTIFAGVRLGGMLSWRKHRRSGDPQGLLT